LIQEFRYATPGGLLVFLFGVGFYLAGGQVGSNGAISAALGSLAIGWITYQWIAYLIYRQGGLEDYHEIRVLKNILERATNGRIAFIVQGHEVLIDAKELSSKIRELGKRYSAALPHQTAKDESVAYWAPVHDALFAGVKEHEYARGAYSIHHTLSIIYWVLLWGVNFISLAFITKSQTSLKVKSISLVVLWLGQIGLIALAANVSRNFRKVPFHYYITTLSIDFAPIIFIVLNSPVSAVTRYLILCVAFGIYLLSASFTPWRMVLLEAELREELMTWMFQRSLSGRAPSVPNK
jgi:hypothetical protein